VSRHVSRNKLSRKELVQKDEITARLEQGAEYIWDNPRPFLWGVSLVVLAGIAVAAWTVYSARREAASQIALAAVIQSYNDTLTFASDEARYQATVTEAMRVEQDYAGSSAEQVARYFRALSHEGLGETEEAVSLLEDLAGSSDPAIRPLARFALGQSLKAQGELDRAIQLYDDLLTAGEYAADTLVFELGQLHEAADRVDEARALYESLVSEYPGSVYQSEAERALKRIATTGPGSA
jgi:TolA-binding protein